ncbi:MAG: stage II sporulation protein M [Clostridia bacterium]|nr:stage II sporulation protein M [Clostridia bacterium]
MKRLMIYTKKRNFDFFGFASMLKSNSNLILLNSLFLCGLIIGSVLAATSVDIFNTTESILANNKPIEYFINTLMYSVIIIIISFCSGLCSIGITFILPLPILNGMAFGVISGTLLFTCGLKGLLSFILMQLPVATVIALLIIISSGISLDMSASIASYVFFGKRAEIKIKEYIISYILIILLCVASALTAMVFQILFDGLINY